MDATLFAIQNRARVHAAAFASREHFTLVDGQAATPQLVIDEPGWSPYCLDDENRSVLFVHVPPHVDLAQAKFVYTTQFEQAQRALLVPYAVLERLAEQVKTPNKIIFIYSIGRCGSTLMSQIFSQIEGVYSLSEPDIYTNISLLPTWATRRDELLPVLKACTLLLTQRQPEIAVLKFRSHGIRLSDWFYAAFPQAYNLFMYRNAVSWAQSVHRFLQRLGLPNQLKWDEALQLWCDLTGEKIAYVESFVNVDQDLLYFSDLLAPAWTSYLDWYMTHYQSGVPFHSIRYEALNDQREATLHAVFDYCGLPTSHLSQAIRAFETDSQAGTAISRDVAAADLPPERVEHFLKLLSQHARFANPDIVLPDVHTPRSV